MAKKSEVNGESIPDNSVPVKEMSFEELKASNAKVMQKHSADWTSDDFDILWEYRKRQWDEYVSRYEEMKKNIEFDQDEWIRFLTEVAVDTYYVVKRQEYENITIKWQMSMINRRLTDINNNVCSIPLPPPPYPPAIPDLSGLEWKLDEILRLLGGGISWP